MPTKEREFNVSAKSKNYMLSTSEYIGTEDLKYMIRSELQGNSGKTLFLLGVPNPALVYANGIYEPQTAKDRLYQGAVDSIADYLSNNPWSEGQTYYGEYMIDGSFRITKERPRWEDGKWGQKI